MGKKQDRKEQQASNARSGAGSGDAAASEGLNKAAYLEQLAPMQLELNRVARWLQYTGKRLMVLIEGRDTAGKGGVCLLYTSRRHRACSRPVRRDGR